MSQHAGDLRTLVARRAGLKRRVALLVDDAALKDVLEKNGCTVLVDPSLEELSAFDPQVIAAFDGFAREKAESFRQLVRAAPEAVDLTRESPETLALYGIDRPRTADFGRKCLIARRMVERGVRFVQIYSGGAHNDDNWDAHSDLVANHSKHAGNTDRPIAGLIADLKRRGLLDETLIVWGGEFGRQPTAENAQGTGRDHNSYGFTMWAAGGGIKGGVSVGATDELGSAAVERPLHVKQLHATILHQMGIDPNRLSYFYGGLDQKLVGVEPVEPIREII